MKYKNAIQKILPESKVVILFQFPFTFTFCLGKLVFAFTNNNKMIKFMNGKNLYKVFAFWLKTSVYSTLRMRIESRFPEKPFNSIHYMFEV